MKQERDQRDVARVVSLTDDFLENVKHQEDWFHTFSDHYKKVDIACQKCKLDKEIADLVCKSTLDKWAFSLDGLQAKESMENFEEQMMKPFDADLSKLKFSKLPGKQVDPVERSLLGYLSNDNILSVIETPSRKLALAKIFANKQLTNLALKIFNWLIKNESLVYPAAQYYKAYLIAKESEEFSTKLDEVLKELFAVEKILTKCISMLYSFSAVVSVFTPSRQSELHQNNSYQKQKENDIFLLEIIKGSISFIAGGHCTIERLEDMGLDIETAEKAFEFLVRNNIVLTCQTNSQQQIQNYYAELENIATNFGIDVKSVVEFLQTLETENLDSKSLEKRIKSTFKSGAFKWNKKSFWKTLDRHGALKDSVSVLGISKDHLETVEELKALSENEAKKTELFDAFLHPLEENGLSRSTLYFEKIKVKQMFGMAYKKFKKYFFSNKFGRLVQDGEVIQRLKEETVWGKIDEKDLMKLGISSRDVPVILNQMVKSEIIKKNGTLRHLQEKWRSLQFPVYDEMINQFLHQKFLPKNAWLAMISGNKAAIEELPTSPAHNFLIDLFRSRLIVHPTVSTEVSVEKLKNVFFDTAKLVFCKDEIQINFPDRLVRQKIFNFLERYQASHAQKKKVKVELYSLAQQVEEIKKFDGNQVQASINTELALLKTSGFDEILILNEGKWYKQMYTRQTVATIMGLAQLAIGAIVLTWLRIIPGFNQISKTVFLQGINDIMFVFSAKLANNNYSYNDYCELKLQNLHTGPYSISFGPSTLISMWSKQNLNVNSQEVKRAVKFFSTIENELSSRILNHEKRLNAASNFVKDLFSELTSHVHKSFMKNQSLQKMIACMSKSDSGERYVNSAMDETFLSLADYLQNKKRLLQDTRSYLDVWMPNGKGNISEILDGFHLFSKYSSLALTFLTDFSIAVNRNCYYITCLPQQIEQ